MSGCNPLHLIFLGKNVDNWKLNYAWSCSEDYECGVVYIGYVCSCVTLRLVGWVGGVGLILLRVRPQWWVTWSTLTEKRFAYPQKKKHAVFAVCALPFA